MKIKTVGYTIHNIPNGLMTTLTPLSMLTDIPELMLGCDKIIERLTDYFKKFRILSHLVNVLNQMLLSISRCLVNKELLYDSYYTKRNIEVCKLLSIRIHNEL